MPAKPRWIGNIDVVIQELAALPRPFVDRATVESLLGVGRRRAQQILAPCVTDRVGSNGLADRERVIERLRQISQGQEGLYERRRRQRVGERLAKLHQDFVARPRVLVEAPVRVASHDLADLPEGVSLEPGRITIDFVHPREALEKLLALAMAIGNDYDRFERAISGGDR